MWKSSRIPRLGILLLGVIVILGMLICARGFVEPVRGASVVTTAITLLPAGGSTPLNSSNGFLVTTLYNGTQKTTSEAGGAFAVQSDVGAPVLIAGKSTLSSEKERWVFDSQSDSVSVTPGSTATYYYYDVLRQPTAYAISGGGNPSPPSITYFGAPPVASGAVNETAYSSPLPRFSSLFVEPVKGSVISVTSAGQSGPVEHWAPPASTWVASSSSPVPFPFVFYHQFYESLSYNVSGGGNAYSSPGVVCSNFGIGRAIQAGSTAWVDAGTTCHYDRVLPSSLQKEQWALSPASDLTVTSPGTLAPVYYHQYLVTVNYSVSGGGSWTSPSFNVTLFGVHRSIGIPEHAPAEPGMVDAGSLFTLSNPLPSSTAHERWTTSSPTLGVVNGPLNITATYYHQFLITVAYKSSNSRTTPAPSFNYSALGQPADIVLSYLPQPIWADSGSGYHVLPVLEGSNSTVRWFSASDDGVVQAAASITFSYVRQFILKTSGGPLGSRWFDSGVKVALSFQNVYARDAGSGRRVTSYAVDGGASVTVSPTVGNTTIVVLMNKPRQLAFESVAQYQVAIDSAALSALASITPPTVPLDNYWYDAGTPVSVALNGVWARTAGAGERLVAYSFDGKTTSVSTTGTVGVLATSSISSPHSVVGTMQVQYLLNILSGSLSSETPPPIAGDNGWFDAGTTVTASFDYSWSANGSQRLNAIGWETDSSTPFKLQSSGTGTFAAQLVMNGPHGIKVVSVVQYRVQVSGGSGLVFSPPSRTNDTFYDSGSTLVVSSSNVWAVVPGSQRENLVGVTINGKTINVTRSDAGTYSTPAFTIAGRSSVVFRSLRQYLVSFNVKPSSGTGRITPAVFTLDLGSQGIMSVSGFQIWLDSGARYKVSSLQWEGVDVSPANASYTVVTGPQTDVIKAQVYEATLRVTDYLGLPVAGAKVVLVLANATSFTLVTGGDGTVSLGMIPMGTFKATISGVGSSATVSGDASKEPVVTGRLPLSYPVVGIIIAVAVAACLAVVLVRRRRRPTEATEEHLLGENWGRAALLAKRSNHRHEWAPRCPRC